MIHFTLGIIWPIPNNGRLFLLGILLLLGSIESKADLEDPSLEYFRVYDLQDTWQIYDTEYEAYVPYIQNRHRRANVASMWISLEEQQDYSLIFYAFEPSYVFINNELCKSIKEEGWVSFSLDSLSKLYAQKKVFLTFYDKNNRLPLENIFIGGNLKQDGKESSSSPNVIPTLEVFPREVAYPRYFTIIIFIGILIAYTSILNYYPKSFASFYSIRSSLSNMSRIDENLINKPLNIVNLVFLSAHAFVLSFLIVLINLPFFTEANATWLGIQNSFIGLIGYFFLIFLFVLGLGILKYLISVIFGSLLNVEKGTVNTHFFEYIRLSMIFYSSVIIFPVFIHVSQPFNLPEFISYFSYILVSFHIIQSFLVSFYVIQQTHDKSLYLFYYLCIIELMPLLVGIKLLSI